MLITMQFNELLHLFSQFGMNMYAVYTWQLDLETVASIFTYYETTSVSLVVDYLVEGSHH